MVLDIKKLIEKERIKAEIRKRAKLRFKEENKPLTEDERLIAYEKQYEEKLRTPRQKIKIKKFSYPNFKSSKRRRAKISEGLQRSFTPSPVFQYDILGQPKRIFYSTQIERDPQIKQMKERLEEIRRRKVFASPQYRDALRERRRALQREINKQTTLMRPEEQHKFNLFAKRPDSISVLGTPKVDIMKKRPDSISVLGYSPEQEQSNILRARYVFK